MLAGGGVLVATLLNPLGIGAYVYLISMGTSPISQQFVSEWQPPVLSQSLTWPFWALLVIAGVIFVLHRPRRVDITVLAAACLTALALRYLRMVPFAVIALVPVLSARLPRRPRLAEPRTLANVLLLGALVLCAVLTTPYVRLAAGASAGSLIDPYFPATACRALARLGSEDGRVFTLAEWGGYVGWQLWPDMQPFVDGRVELPPVAAWQDYLAITTGQPGWQERLRSWGILYLLLSQQRQEQLIGLAMAYGWQLLYEDADAVVLLSPELGVSY